EASKPHPQLAIVYTRSTDDGLYAKKESNRRRMRPALTD
ncbi:MAG: hypothetical protein RL212_586, partial [Pseudomonadota bacterium]